MGAGITGGVVFLAPVNARRPARLAALRPVGPAPHIGLVAPAMLVSVEGESFLFLFRLEHPTFRVAGAPPLLPTTAIGVCWSAV